VELPNKVKISFTISCDEEIFINGTSYRVSDLALNSKVKSLNTDPKQTRLCARSCPIHQQDNHPQ